MDWYLLPVFAGVELEPHADVDLPIPHLVTSQEPVGDQTPAGTRNTKTIVQPRCSNVAMKGKGTYEYDQVYPLKRAYSQVKKVHN